MEYNFKEIFNQLEDEGYAIIDNFWDDKLNLEIDDYYKTKVEPLFNKTSINKFGNRSFTSADNEVVDSPFEKIKNSPIFKNLYLKLLECNNININEDIDMHNIIYLQKNEVNTN